MSNSDDKMDQPPKMADSQSKPEAHMSTNSYEKRYADMESIKVESALDNRIIKVSNASKKENKKNDNNE